MIYRQSVGQNKAENRLQIKFLLTETKILNVLIILPHEWFVNYVHLLITEGYRTVMIFTFFMLIIWAIVSTGILRVSTYFAIPLKTIFIKYWSIFKSSVAFFKHSFCLNV